MSLGGLVIALLVCVCGGLGAVLRFVLDTVVKSRWNGRFPLSTLVINALASFAAGAVAAALTGGALAEPAHLALATGFLGGFSTFSTMINESVTLLGDRGDGRRYLHATANLACELLVPWVCVALGWWLVA